MRSNTRNRLALVVFCAAATAVLALAVPASAKSPIVHKVSVGGPDSCVPLGFDGPGCNANYSIEAKQFADGTVTGQYTDQFGHGDGGFHATVDCLSVVGNSAWIGGVITSGSYGNVGDRVVTRVVDNGNNANDPPDQITYSYLSNISCTTHFSSPLLDAPQGRVKVS